VSCVAQVSFAEADNAQALGAPTPIADALNLRVNLAAKPLDELDQIENEVLPPNICHLPVVYSPADDYHRCFHGPSIRSRCFVLVRRVGNFRKSLAREPTGELTAGFCISLYVTIAIVSMIGAALLYPVRKRERSAFGIGDFSGSKFGNVYSDADDFIRGTAREALFVNIIHRSRG
jgi:hypothetical protein